MMPIENTTTKRVNYKMLVCLTCKKATYRRISGGAISFFDNCTLTENCSGRMVRDKNQRPSPRSDLTWRERTRVYKHSFTNKQIVEIPHRFGHLGSVIVEPFVEVNSTTGITTIKQMTFTVLEQTATTITIDLGFTRSGTIVVTDNQYQLPKKAAVSQYTPSPTLLLNTTLTIAVDREIPILSVPIQVKSLSAQAFTTTTIDFTNHITNPQAIVGQSPFNQFHYIATDKPYYLYSAVIPQQLLVRGNTLNLVIAADWFIPLTTTPGTTTSDIIMNQYWRGSNIKFGDLVAEMYQLVLSDTSSITTLPKQFVIV